MKQEKDGDFGLLVTRQRGGCPGLVFSFPRKYYCKRLYHEKGRERSVVSSSNHLHTFLTVPFYKDLPALRNTHAQTKSIDLFIYIILPQNMIQKKVLFFVFARGQGSNVLLLVVVANFYFVIISDAWCVWNLTGCGPVHSSYFQHRAPSFFSKQLTNLIFLKFINQFLA